MKNSDFKGKARFIRPIIYFGFSLIWANANASQSLNILNWDDYLSEDVIADWEEQNDAKIRIITYDDEAKRDALLTNTRQHEIDLAIVDAQSAKKLIHLDYVMKITDPGVKAGIDSRWLKQCGHYATPYLWGTFGIAYRADKVSSPVTAWADLFSSRDDLVGHIGMISDYYSLTAPALLTLNLPPNSEDRAVLMQAFELLKKQTQDVLTYDYAPSFLLNTSEKDKLYAAAVYSGDQYTMDELVGSEVWRYILPDEGSFVWLDCWIIPKTSKKKNLAMSFLKFIGQPKVAAFNSEEVGVATVNNAAYELQSDEFKNNDLIYPSKEIIKKLLPFDALSDSNIGQRNRIVEAVKVVHESK